MSNEKRWLQPPKESKYDSSWFVSPIVKNKPDIYRYKKKPLSNDDTYSDDSDYYEDDFESDDEDVGEFKNKEKVFDESIKRTRYDILEKEKQKRKDDKYRRSSKQWDIDINRPLTDIQQKRWKLQQINKKGGNKKNNKNLVYMSGKNPFAKLRQLLSRRKRSRKRFSRRRMGSRRRSMRRRMGSRRRSMRRRMGSMRRRRRSRRRSRAKVAILRKLPDGDVLVDMPPYRRRKRSRRRRRRRGRSGRRMGSMRRRFGRSMRRRNKSKRKRRRKRRK